MYIYIYMDTKTVDIQKSQEHTRRIHIPGTYRPMPRNIYIDIYTPAEWPTGATTGVRNAPPRAGAAELKIEPAPEIEPRLEPNAEPEIACRHMWRCGGAVEPMPIAGSSPAPINTKWVGHKKVGVFTLCVLCVLSLV